MTRVIAILLASCLAVVARATSDAPLEQSTSLVSNQDDVSGRSLVELSEDDSIASPTLHNADMLEAGLLQEGSSSSRLFSGGESLHQMSGEDEGAGARHQGKG